jgi:hypothetical protein
MSPSLNLTETELLRHNELVSGLSEFDRVDIGQKIADKPSDLANVKNMLVTGGAGFM